MEVFLIEASSANRRFNREITQLIDKLVKISLRNGKWYQGTLIGVDLTTLTLCLDNVTSDSEETIIKLFIQGSTWETISLESKPFPIEELYERIASTFPPGQVKLIGETISVLNGKIKVTAAGVEGSGVTLKHVRKIFDQFMEDVEAADEE